MAKFGIGFSWRRADDYEIRRVQKLVEPPSESILLASEGGLLGGMLKPPPRKSRRKSAPEIAYPADFPVLLRPTGLEIVPVGASQAIFPLEAKVELLGAGLLTLFHQEGLERAVKHFARLYGLLCRQDGKSETLDVWAGLIHWLKHNTEPGRHFRQPLNIGLIEARIVPSALGVPILKMVPQDLGSAILLQMGQSLAGGNEVVACAACGTYFEVGQGGRRKDAKFCSDACRYRQHNHSKAKSRKRRAR
jgi:hypothetical protein